MTGHADTITVRVTHRFGASAERVYDAFLDPARAGMFLFATATGRIVRCEIDPRVAGCSRSSIAVAAKTSRTPASTSRSSGRG